MADILNVYEGRADFELTQLGKQQAAQMAQWVCKHMQIDKIYSSPLKRAQQTAGFLSRAADREICLDDDLMEFQNGLIAGLPPEEANRKYPAPAVKYPHTAVYNQESTLHFRMRAETVFSKIIYENNPDATIAIVSHSGAINMLFQCFLMLPTVSGISISTGDTGIHKWQIQGEKRRVVFANSQIHLQLSN